MAESWRDVVLQWGGRLLARGRSHDPRAAHSDPVYWPEPFHDGIGSLPSGEPMGPAAGAQSEPALAGALAAMAPNPTLCTGSRIFQVLDGPNGLVFVEISPQSVSGQTK